MFLCREFLFKGHDIVICGRDAEQLQAALATLRRDFPGRVVEGIEADVSSPADVQQLSDLVSRSLPVVGYWINNAGAVTTNKLLADVGEEEIVRVVGSNVVGSLLGCRCVQARCTRGCACLP